MADAASVRMAHRTVESGGLRLAVFESPRVGPTMVLVHGFPDTHTVWDPVVARLQDRFHCVAYDVRGAGQSDAPAPVSDYAVEHLVADLVAVVDALSPDQPVHLVGHDWGSVQAWAAILREKTDDRLTGRIAGFTTISGPSLDQIRAFSAALLRGGLQDKAQGLEQLLRSWYVFAFQLPWIPEYVVRRQSRRLLDQNGHHRLHFQPTLPEDAVHGLNIYRANLVKVLASSDLAATDIPVQLVVALRDSFVRPQLTQDTHRFASDLTRVEIDSGHWVQQSHPDELAAALASFHGRDTGSNSAGRWMPGTGR